MKWLQFILLNLCMQNFKTLFKYWKSIAITGIILYLSFAPPSDFKGIPTFNNEDKLIHFLMYLAFSGLLIVDYTYNSLKRTEQKLKLLSLVFPVALGGVIEVLQPILAAPRTGSWLDWYADIFGVLAGWWIMKVILQKIKR